MEFSTIIGLTVLVAVSFFVTEKRLHPYEYVFCYLVFVGLLVTFLDVMSPMNARYLIIHKEEVNLYWTLRLAEVFLAPLLVLFYLEGMNTLRSMLGKGMATLGTILLLVGLESGLALMQVFTYDQWQRWWSPVAWLVALLTMYGFQRGYRRLLRREGVVA